MKKVDRSFAASCIRSALVACIVVLGTTAGAHAAPPAPSVPDDPAKVAAAKEFIQLYHPQTQPKSVAAMLDRYMPRAIAAAKQDDPKLDVRKFERETRARMLASTAAKLDLQAHVVSRHFTLPELKALIAFYSSPLGRKLSEETVKITRELMAAKKQGGPAGTAAPLQPQPPAKPAVQHK